MWLRWPVSSRYGSPCHVKDLRPFRGSHSLDDESDTEDSEQPIYLNLGSASDPSDIGASPTNPNISSESSLEEVEIQMISLQKSTWKKTPHPHCHLCDPEIRRECHKHDDQEFESDNDLPYRCHKRTCFCLVCEALMQVENEYTLALQYLCLLISCDQHALPTIKEGGIDE